MRCFVAAALASAFVAGGSLPTLGSGQTATTSPPPAMPGRLVAIEAGHRLHLWCRGEGAPTVILEAGLGAHSVDWSLVHPVIAAKTRVCAYDRAGYAWSDKGPEPRGLGTSARELHQLLERAAVRPPYVLVGQSWGGRIVRVFAHAHPDEVAGMVLIDTYSEGTANVAANALHGLNLHAEEEADPATRLPAAVRAARSWARGLPRQQDISDPDEPEQAIAATTATRKTPLGNKPLFVVSAGRLSWDARDRASGESYASRLREHVASEAFLASLSRNSLFVVARASFHQVHLYEPEVVTGAILQVLESARTGEPLVRPH
jgi:pimeloyl-ACP methyl ester carboxylesterase